MLPVTGSSLPPKSQLLRQIPERYLPQYQDMIELKHRVVECSISAEQLSLTRSKIAWVPQPYAVPGSPELWDFTRPFRGSTLAYRPYSLDSLTTWFRGRHPWKDPVTRLEVLGEEIFVTWPKDGGCGFTVKHGLSIARVEEESCFFGCIDMLGRFTQQRSQLGFYVL